MTEFTDQKIVAIDGKKITVLKEDGLLGLTNDA
jgi:hypothetical protein